ncbi:MAG: FAD-dependent oxidoreductase [Rhodospirillaceae bacterium]
MCALSLGFGLGFGDLYEAAGLARVDHAFLTFLAVADEGLEGRLLAARCFPDGLDAKAESALLLELAPHLEDFLGRLFGIGSEITALAQRYDDLAPLYSCKRLFVQRRAAKAFKPEQAAALDGDSLTASLATLIGETFGELDFAKTVAAWSADEATNAEPLSIAERYAAWALHSPAGRVRHGKGILFQLPVKTDPAHLVPVETVDVAGAAAMQLPHHHRRQREGFDLTDQGTDLAGALDQANYCIWCHHQGKDSCSKGLADRKTGAFQKSPFGVPLTGCPLEEKISEMHAAMVAGQPLAALAIAVIDNPMIAGTGHRICNDCMKACIYQKQQPVDIPQAETRNLKEILHLPWGFELYGLLTRWNPLNLRHPVTKPASGYKVLVVGLGPAGYTLSHYLLNQGHTVVGVDGLKIEPLPADLSGVLPSGERVQFRPIRKIEDLYDRLDERVMAGFGGVAEYGITVRWNKNFLKIIRLLLERRGGMSILGGVRVGGTITVDEAFAAGFDHIALCAGAGRPTVIPMKNGLARGVRQASDFLMALQLTGAAKAESLANLTVRLPVVVIGGGLTAIDTATESLAYYPVQVEKFLSRYDTLVAAKGEDAVRARWSEEERETAAEFLAHARAIRAERAAASAEGREPRLQTLLDGWGGSTVAYRRRLVDSPSYTLNHEEVALAMEEGIRFVESVTPTEVVTDRYGHAAALKLHTADGNDVTLPARTVLVAAGTQPNTVLARETPGFLELDGKYYRALDEHGAHIRPEASPKPSKVAVLTAETSDGRTVSFFGDLHPSFAGNVVRAMAGARKGYPLVCRALGRREPTPIPPADLLAALNRDLRPVVHEVNRLTPTIVEVVVKAPRAASAFQPGQFYRLQNFEALAPRIDGPPFEATTLAMEGLALTGAWVDKGKGLLSTIVLEMGGSSNLCALLKQGEPVVLMGPTGTPTEIPDGETVCLVGGGLGNAVLFSIGQAMRAKGCRVIYFAGYKGLVDRFKVEQIEAAADLVVWCCDEAPGFTPGRASDRTFVGNIVQAIHAYASGALGAPEIPLAEVNRVIAIGSDRMMAAVGEARHTLLRPFLNPDHEAIGSINSPMQCMMKEICAQCLQVHRDPLNGEETVVFTCYNQDQPLDVVDFRNLRERLGQNGTHEKLTAQWIEHCLGRMGAKRMVG